MKKHALIMLALIATGCSKDEVKEDTYPFIEKSELIALGTPISAVYIDNDAPYPVMLSLGENCRMLSSVERYGDHSLKIHPEVVTCEGENVQLTQQIISDAFVDLRFHRKGMIIPFELYQKAW
jgi:hypothetical protein